MSAVDTVPQRAGRPDAARSRLESIRILLRLTLLELRRSPMPLMLPLVAALFWFDALRTGENLPAIWTQRAAILPDHVLPDLGPVAAGMAAWVGGREQRRGIGDLAQSTARPAWLRRLAGWGAATGWTLLAYAACTAVIYVLAARVVNWGGPPVWPVVVIGLAVAAFCTTGFVAGAVLPGRFTAPLAALGTLLVTVMIFQSAVHAASGWVLISPDNSVPQLDWGVFHPVPPDLPIVQAVFLLGFVVVLLGVLGVFSSVRGAQLRRTASTVLAAGLAACVACLALAATAVRGNYGFDISLLHDAASDRPIPYTPVCTQGSAIPVCVHPVFSADLAGASAAFAPLLAEVAGLPGAPTRVMQIDNADLPLPDAGPGHADFTRFDAWSTLAASPGGAPVLEFGFGDPYTFNMPGAVSNLRDQSVPLVIGHIVAPNGNPGPAQQAVERALIQKAAGAPADPNQDPSTPPPTAAVAAAAQRFAALPSAQSHAWLVADLDQLRSGQITLEELP